VWRQLDVDRRQRAISVVAQMAFNVIQTQAASSQQEADDEHATTIDEAAHCALVLTPAKKSTTPSTEKVSQAQR
jgi:hypothetical protein